MEMPAGYPGPGRENAPSVAFEEPVFHPHVWTTKVVCLGQTRTSEFLDLLVERLIRLLLYYPQHINPNSPANRDALTWFHGRHMTFPIERYMSPVDSVIQWKESGGIRWKNN
jgi:ubiquitin-protein ligase